MLAFDQNIDDKAKSYGNCKYEGKEINVDTHKHEL